MKRAAKPNRRHVEIAGAGFGGLVAAVALAERGWSVTVHEKNAAIRAEGFAIATSTRLRGRTALRLCTINPRTTDEDIRATIEQMAAIGQGLTAGAS